MELFLPLEGEGDGYPDKRDTSDYGHDPTKVEGMEHLRREYLAEGGSVVMQAAWSRLRAHRENRAEHVREDEAGGDRTCSGEGVDVCSMAVIDINCSRCDTCKR